MTSYLVLCVDKHPSSALQANPAATRVEARVTVHHGGAGLLAQTSMTIQIYFLSFSCSLQC